MNIAIIGYGKMGRLIEQIAKDRGHNISVVINDSNWSSADLNEVDVAIEFSTPNSVLDNIYKALQSRVNIVVGTTGWYDDYEKVANWVKKFNVALIAATNFSIGVNIFYEINKKLASLMNAHTNFKPTIIETHHLQKLDSPSGTAITIAEQVINRIDGVDKWEEAKVVSKDTLQIIAKRKENVPGTHEVTYENEIDKISIAHEAKNRNGFALGAVIAAEQIVGKKGVYSMSDIIKF